MGRPVLFELHSEPVRLQQGGRGHQQLGVSLLLLGFHDIRSCILGDYDWTACLHESLSTEPQALRGIGGEVIANHDNSDVVDLLPAIFRDLSLHNEMQRGWHSLLRQIHDLLSRLAHLHLRSMHHILSDSLLHQCCGSYALQ